MTSTIETTKRALFDCLERIKRAAKHRTLTAEFEERLEEHLEELRLELQKYAKVNTCGIGVGDGSGRLFVHGDYDSVKAVQEIIIAGEDARNRLLAMTEERDQLQDRLHAVDRAYVVLDQANKVAGEEFNKSQTNVRHWREECGKLQARIRIFESGELYQKLKREAKQHLDDCRTAENRTDELHEKLAHVAAVIGQQERLIVGQRLAIADLYLKARRPSATDGLTRAVSPEPIVKSDWI